MFDISTEFFRALKRSFLLACNVYSVSGGFLFLSVRALQIVLRGGQVGQPTGLCRPRCRNCPQNQDPVSCRVKILSRAYPQYPTSEFAGIKVRQSWQFPEKFLVKADRSPVMVAGGLHTIPHYDVLVRSYCPLVITRQIQMELPASKTGLGSMPRLAAVQVN